MPHDKMTAIHWSIQSASFINCFITTEATIMHLSSIHHSFAIMCRIYVTREEKIDNWIKTETEKLTEKN